MPARQRHPKKEVEAALAAAETDGFLVAPTKSGHRWGYVRCKRCQQQDLSVWSTPRVPENMARNVRRFMKRHSHRGEEEARWKPGRSRCD